MASDVLTRRAFGVGAFGVGALALAGPLLPGIVRSARAAGMIEIAMVTEGAQVAFDPVGLLVDPGTLIRWVLKSGVHTSTAYHPANDHPLRIPEAAKPWGSDYIVDPGATYDVTLTEPGVYDYFCEAHEMAGMVGRIIVGHPAGGPATKPPGDEIPEPARRAFPAIQEILDKKSVPGRPA